MSRTIQHVVDPTDDPKISVLIAARAVASEIIARVFAPILFLVALLVAIDRPQHRRPWATNNYFPADVRADFLSIWIDNRRIDAEKRQRRTSRLGRNRPRQRRDHDRAGFGLPPSVNDWATPAADRLVVPHPRFGINRLADGAQPVAR